MSNSFSGTSPQPSDFVSQLSAMQSSGAQLGTSIANNAEAGATTASNIGLQQAQTGLVQRQSNAQDIANMTGLFRYQMVQWSMQQAQSELQGMATDAGDTDGTGASSDQSGTATPAPSAAAASLGAAQPTATPAPSAAAPGGTSTPNTATPPSGQPTMNLQTLGLDQGDVYHAVDRQYMVPLYTPQEQAAISRARAIDITNGIAGNPSNIAGSLDAQAKMRYQIATNQSQRKASQQYDLYNGAVVQSPPGTALQALARTPGGGQMIAAKITALGKQNDYSPSQMDTLARTVAGEAADRLYNYSGRDKTLGTDNYWKDDTGGNLPGAARVGQNPNSAYSAQMSAYGRAMSALNSTVEVPTGQPGQTKLVPRYEAPFAGHPNGYPTLKAAAIAAGILPPNLSNNFNDDGSRVDGQPITDPTAAGALNGTPAAAPGAAPAGPGGAPVMHPAQRALVRAGIVPAPGAPGATPAPSAVGPGLMPGQPPPLPPMNATSQQTAQYQQSTDRYAQAVSSDPQFYEPQPSYAGNPYGTSATTAQTEAAADMAKTHVAEARTVSNAVNEQVETATLAQTYLGAAKTALANLTTSTPLPTTGPIGQAVSAFDRVFPGQKNTATYYQELAKYLGNAALQGAKATYTSRMSTQEVNMQMTQLSPSSHMTPGAIGDLIDNLNNIAQYQIGEGAAVGRYLQNPKNDPTQYDSWYQKHFPRSYQINTQQAKQGTGAQAQPTQGNGLGLQIVRTGTINGRRVVQYSNGTTAYAQ